MSKTKQEVAFDHIQKGITLLVQHHLVDNMGSESHREAFFIDLGDAVTSAIANHYSEPSQVLRHVIKMWIDEQFTKDGPSLVMVEKGDD